MWYNTHDSQRLEGGLLMKTKSLVNAAMMMAIYLVFFILYNVGILPSIMTLLLPIGTYLIGSVYGLMTTLLYGITGALLGIGIVF